VEMCFLRESSSRGDMKPDRGIFDL